MVGSLLVDIFIILGSQLMWLLLLPSNATLNKMYQTSMHRPRKVNPMTRSASMPMSYVDEALYENLPSRKQCIHHLCQTLWIVNWFFPSALPSHIWPHALTSVLHSILGKGEESKEETPFLRMKMWCVTCTGFEGDNLQAQMNSLLFPPDTMSPSFRIHVQIHWVIRQEMPICMKHIVMI